MIASIRTFLGAFLKVACVTYYFTGFLLAQEACTFNRRVDSDHILTIFNSVNVFEDEYIVVGIADASEPPYAWGSEIYRFDSLGDFQTPYFLSSETRTLEAWGRESHITPFGELFFTGYSYGAQGRELFLGKYDLAFDTVSYVTVPNSFYPQEDWYTGLGLVGYDEGVYVFGNHYDVFESVSSTATIDLVDTELNVQRKLTIARFLPSAATMFDLIKNTESQHIVLWSEFQENTFCEPYRRLHLQKYGQDFGTLISDYKFPNSQDFIPVSGTLCEGAEGVIYMQVLEMNYLNTNPNCNAAHTLSPKVYKFNDTLGLVWTADFTREQDPDWDSSAADVVAAGDGNFVTAFSQSILVDTTALVFQTALQLVKFSPEGELIWRRMYSSFGANDTVSVKNEIYDLKATPDGGFVMVGESKRNATNFETDTADVYFQRGWILKVDADGLLQPSCLDTTVSSVFVSPERVVDALVFPNPAADLLNIRPEGRWRTELSFRVVDQLGRTVMFRKRNLPFVGSVNYTMDIEDFPPGMYRVLIEDGERTVVKAFVKR